MGLVLTLVSGLSWLLLYVGVFWLVGDGWKRARGVAALGKEDDARKKGNEMLMFYAS